MNLPRIYSVSSLQRGERYVNTFPQRCCNHRSGSQFEHMVFLSLYPSQKQVCKPILESMINYIELPCVLYEYLGNSQKYFSLATTANTGEVSHISYIQVDRIIQYLIRTRRGDHNLRLKFCSNTASLFMMVFLMYRQLLFQASQKSFENCNTTE